MDTRPQPNPGIKRPVSPPKIPLPKGAWDCHAHVFGPFDVFPVVPERRYEPLEAPVEHYLEMLDTVGFENGVIVHASAQGFVPTNVADALARRPGRLIGVAVVTAETTDKEFEALHEQGFRALRFTENGNHSGRSPGTLYFDDLEKLAPRLKSFGWHAQIWGRCDLLMERKSQLAGYGLPLIFDHLGYFDTPKGIDQPAFRTFLQWLATGDFCVKATAVRISKQAPDYADGRPFFEALMKAVPDQLVFGSDWPYLSLDDDPPDVGRMVDLFDRWMGDDTLRRKLFVDNPTRFYRR